MTREEAVNELNDRIELAEYVDSDYIDYASVDAIKMAISALSVHETNVEGTISRQAAIDALHTYFEDGFEQDRWWNSMHVLKAIRGVSSAQQWIPVTEILPEDGAEVWVTTEMLFEVTRARWHKDTNLWCHPYNADCVLVLRPIAWMEMSFPEPYKGGVE